MRKLRWPIAILILLALCGIFFFRRTPPDDLAIALKPYIVQDKTSYALSDYLIFMAGDPNAPAYLEREIEVRGMTREQVKTILTEIVGRRKGWSVSSVLPPTFFKATGRARYNNLYAMPSAPLGGRFTITEGKTLSTWDVWMLRLKNIGRDPFERPIDSM